MSASDPQLPLQIEDAGRRVTDDEEGNFAKVRLFCQKNGKSPRVSKHHDSASDSFLPGEPRHPPGQPRAGPAHPDQPGHLQTRGRSVRSLPRHVDQGRLRRDPHAEDHQRRLRGRSQRVQDELLQGLRLPRSVAAAVQADGHRRRLRQGFHTSTSCPCASSWSRRCSLWVESSVQKIPTHTDISQSSWASTWRWRSNIITMRYK